MLAASDPAQPYGAALPWPKRAGARAARVAGALRRPARRRGGALRRARRPLARPAARARRGVAAPGARRARRAREAAAARSGSRSSASTASRSSRATSMPLLVEAGFLAGPAPRGAPAANRAMPEGDALHRAARRLALLVGERVEAESPHPRAQVTGVAPRIDGRRLEAVEAVGKNLFLRFEGGVTVRSHLRMSGRWRVEPRGAARVGRPWLVLRGAAQRGRALERASARARALEARRWRLGPDVLTDDLSGVARPRADRRGAARPAAGLRDRQRLALRGALARAVSPWAPSRDESTSRRSSPTRTG